MADDPPNELKAALAEGRALIVCGAGVSMAATAGAAPGWRGLIEAGLERAVALHAASGESWVKACRDYLSDKNADEWLYAADRVQEKLGGYDGAEYRGFFSEALSTLRNAKPALLTAIRKLAELGNPVATTNYDHLISATFGRDRVDWLNHAGVIEALRGKRKSVWHIHGDYDRPPSVIFSRNDYNRIGEHEFSQFVQQLASLNFTFVFIGCSGSGLADSNVGALLKWWRKGFAGLGDRHFALTTDDNKDPWPAGVIPVRVGTRDDLAAYLEKLAPAPRAVASFPPDPKMIGREDRLKELVEAILTQERPILVPGALGMGKTTLALAAAYDPEVVKHFGRDRRFFVNLEPVPDADGIVRSLAAALSLDASGVIRALEQAIADACTRPALVILDNMETPWAKEPASTEAALGRLAEIAGLHLIVTVRGDLPWVPGGRVPLRDVKSLRFDQARELFLREAGAQHASDPALPELLRALDGHPLSIELVAANAAGKDDLTGLVADWTAHRPEMFKRARGDTRLTSLFVSLEISMDALEANSPAHRLVRAMALLPAGMAEGDCEATLSDGAPTAAENAAAAKLEKARLATRRDGRWHLLAPVREALLQAYPPDAADWARLVKLFLGRADLGQRIGTAGWDEVRESVTAEAGNFDAMIGVASAEAAPLEGLVAAVRGLAQFHSYTGLASVASLGSAVSSLGRAGDVLGEANCIQSLGDIALARSDIEAARARYEAALPVYRKVGDAQGEANCIRSLGDIAEKKDDIAAARRLWNEALALYGRIPEPYSMGHTHLLLARRATTPAEAEGHREAARRAWASIDRTDLIAKYLDEAP